MKLVCLMAVLQLFDAPHAGARIEIKWNKSNSFQSNDAPHAGARIEMPFGPVGPVGPVADAPHAGARIEITKQQGSSSTNMRRPPRGGEN